MDERQKLAFEYAQEVCKQLIGLSTGIIALTITFSKDFVGKVPQSDRWLAIGAWVGLLLSIICGIWTMLAITGTLEQSEEKVPISIRGKNVTIPATLQVSLFLGGLLMTVLFGIIALKSGGIRIPPH